MDVNTVKSILEGDFWAVTSSNNGSKTSSSSMLDEQNEPTPVSAPDSLDPSSFMPILDMQDDETQLVDEKLGSLSQSGSENPNFSSGQNAGNDGDSSSGICTPSIAARRRRSKIRDRLKLLQDLLPVAPLLPSTTTTTSSSSSSASGNKLDTVGMLDEAISYVKFLKAQVHVLDVLFSESQHQQKKQSKLQIIAMLLKSPVIQWHLYTSQQCLSISRN